MMNSTDDLNDETDPVTQQEDEATGEKPKKLKLDGRGNPFSKHPESWSVFSSITESPTFVFVLGHFLKNLTSL